MRPRGGTPVLAAYEGGGRGLTPDADTTGPIMWSALTPGRSRGLERSRPQAPREMSGIQHEIWVWLA